MTKDKEEKLVFLGNGQALKVKYVDHMGTDKTPVNAARISRSKEKSAKGSLTVKDIRLMTFLAKNKHMTPFEHQALSVIVYCPLYIRSQIHRHRTFSYNEVSRRYTSEDVEFYIPDKFYHQSIKNKQGGAEEFDLQMYGNSKNELQNSCKLAYDKYREFLTKGMAREAARAVLPQNLMTHFYMTGNLRNWVHFLKLRLDSHAQLESRIIAQKVKKIAEKLWPETTKVLLENL